MLNRFLSTFGALALFALLVGSGTREPTPAARVLAKAISEIPITHHFSAYLPAVGSVYGWSAGPAPLIGTMPAQTGVAIAQLTAPYGQFVVRIDGVEVFVTPNFPSGAGIGQVTITPPLIAPPGSIVEIGQTAAPNTSIGLTVTGYTLEPAYFGGP